MINNNYCEFNYRSMDKFIPTSCGMNFFITEIKDHCLIINGHDKSKYLNYCPNCGKKIKIIK